MTTETKTIKMGVSPNIINYIRAAISAQDGKFLCAGDNDRDRVASFENWAVTYLIAKSMRDNGLGDEDVNDYVLTLKRADEEDEA